MSVNDQYESAHAAVQAFKEIRVKLDEINKYSADIDDLEDAVFALMDDVDDAQAKAQAVIDNIDDQGGVAAVERDMAAEARYDAQKEEEGRS